MSKYCEFCGSTLIEGGCSACGAGPAVGVGYRASISAAKWRLLNNGVSPTLKVSIPAADWRALIHAVHLPISIKPPGAVHNPFFRAAMYRAAGLDPDGEPVGLPKRGDPEERPFVPNKFGEHD